MLRRRSIRTKLFVALMLLSAIVGVLAVSSFWGLYRYRSVAQSLGRRATELPLANELNRCSETLRDTHHRLSELIQHEGMIESSVLDTALMAQERAAFEQALFECDLILSRYTSVVAHESSATSLFIDFHQQQERFGEIRRTLDSLTSMRNNPNHADHAGRLEFRRSLDTLVDLSREHLNHIHSGMAEFGDDVRGQYRVWIGAAWFSLAAAVVLVGALLWLFTSLIVQPFRTLLDGSRLVAGGEFSHRIDLGTGDELCELADAMNDMTDLFQDAYQQLNDVCADLDRQVRQRTREVIQNEQLASVGFLAAGVAHEINNPLATIAWSAESLESRIEELTQSDQQDRRVDDEILSALQTNLRRIQDEAYRCKGITERLLDFSRLGEVKRAPTDLATLTRDVVEMVGKVGKYRCKTLRFEGDDDTVAEVNPQEIRQVVLNLLTNALECVDCDGAVDIRVRRCGESVLISVTDNGCGMTPSVLQHLFEPFFTRRADGSGTGLGLSISFRIVSQHGGTLTPHSDGPGMGSRMELMLPVCATSTDKKSPHHISTSPTSSRWNHESYQAA